MVSKRKLKKMSKPVDLSNVIKKIKQISKISPAHKKLAEIKLNESFENVGSMFLGRAMDEKVLTIDEIDKSNLSTKDWATILQGYYGRKDKHFKKDERIVIVTLDTSEIYKEKKWLQKKFNLKIVDVVKATEMMKKRDEVSK